MIGFPLRLSASARERNSLKLRKTYIEIATACNLACSFCGGTRRAAQFMAPALFARILEQIQGISRRIYFHVMGEPLLHPQVVRFLDHCEPYGYDVCLVTNGRLLPGMASELLGRPALRQVGVSLHSLPHGVSDHDLDAFLVPVRDFASRAQDQGRLGVVLRLWNTDSGDPNEAESNARISRTIERVWALPSALAIDSGGKAAIKLGPNLSLQFAARFQWPDPTGPSQGSRGTCYGLRDQCAILVDGTVVPCCLDRDAVMALGSVAQRPLREILAGERANRIRQGFSRQVVVEPLCRRCTYRRRFDRPR